MKTRITELLGCQYTVVQGGMAWVAEYHLAAAVSDAGGIGLIGAASAPAEVVREQIRKVKELTDKPFGVNVMLLNPNAQEVAQVIVEEGVKIVTTGAGNPGKFMEMWKNAGVTVIPVVASVAMAKMMQSAGADAVVAEGMEYIRHLRDLNDRIEGEAISEKLYRLENLLKEIFDRVQEHPEQMHRMHKLMDYYLPTMLKLVEQYAEFDEISSPGDDILDAKKEIEKTLDMINQAFVTLLNNLFRDAAFDASADAQVLQTMLAKEGLTESDFVREKSV